MPGESTSQKNKGRLQTKRIIGLAIGLATNFFGGTVYVFPNYTVQLQKHTGIDNGGITVAGVICHFGLAMVSFPLGLFYFQNEKVSDRMKDVVVSLACLIPEAIALITLGFVDKLWCKDRMSECTGDPTFIATTQWLIWILYLIYGLGVGAGFGHAIWVSGSNFRETSKIKSAVVSSISLAMGVGSLFFAIIYPFTFANVQLSDFYFMQGGAYIVVGIIRTAFMVRLTEEELEVFAVEKTEEEEEEEVAGGFTKNESALLAAGSGSAFGISASMRRRQSSRRLRQNKSRGGGDLLSEKNPLMNSAKFGSSYLSQNSSLPKIKESPSCEMGRLKSNPSLMDGGMMDDTKLLATVDEDAGIMHDIDEDEEEEGINCAKHCCVLASDPVVYLTWITAFVGIGIGGTFESMIGFLSTSFVPPVDQIGVIRGEESAAAEKQAKFVGHVSVILFLAFQVLARITATVIVKLRKWQSYLFIMWMASEVIGMGFIMFQPLVEWSFILGTAFIGFGFGGTLSTLTAHVAVHFPGGIMAFPYNLGLALLAPGFGNLILGVLEDAIDTSPCMVAASQLNMSAYEGCMTASDSCAWFNGSLNHFINDPNFVFPQGFFNATPSKKWCVEKCEFNALNTGSYNGAPSWNTFKFWKSCYINTYTLFYTVIVIAFITSILNVIFVQKEERRKRKLGIVEEDVEIVGGH